MKITLIITTYNWPASLLLVIQSIRNQTIWPNEIITSFDIDNEIRYLKALLRMMEAEMKQKN